MLLPARKYSVRLLDAFDFAKNPTLILYAINAKINIKSIIMVFIYFLGESICMFLIL